VLGSVFRTATSANSVSCRVNTASQSNDDRGAVGSVGCRHRLRKIDLAAVKFGFDLSGRLNHVGHLLVGGIPRQELQPAVGADREPFRRDDLQALFDVFLDLLDGFDLGGVNVDHAECEIRHEIRLGEDIDLFVAAVAEFEIDLINRVLVEFGIDAGVVAVTDVQADADVLVDPADDPV
jgi:hypothetical protein